MKFLPIITVLIIAACILGAAVLVYQNRASDKLVSSAMSVAVLGSIGLVISAIIGLKTTSTNNAFPAVTLIGKHPLSLPLYSGIVLRHKGSALLTINNTLKWATNEFYNKPNTVDIETINDVTEKCIIDLLSSRYSYHWLVESLEIKLPIGRSVVSANPDPNIKYRSVKLDEIHKVFHDNRLFKYPEPNPRYPKFAEFVLPPKMTFTREKLDLNRILIFDNNFVTLRIEIQPQLFGEIPSNSSILSVLELKNADNYAFQPYVFKYSITQKKWRSGHPDMDNYSYWSEDLVQFLKDELSADSFWKTIESLK